MTTTKRRDAATTRDVAATQFVRWHWRRVAVIDSGVADILTCIMRARSRVVHSDSLIRRFDDRRKYGHGTHVLALFGGNGASRESTLCRMPHGRWSEHHQPRVLDQNGAGRTARRLQHSACDRSQVNLHIRVIKLVVGPGIWESYTLDRLPGVESAWKAGIVVVVAAVIAAATIPWAQMVCHSWRAGATTRMR